MARVSVVVPVYNIAAHLRQCLDSVVGQSLKDLEIICVDDGSTDESPVILSEYAAQDRRVQIITQANAGPGAARNAGLACATGDYLIFLDSDDWFEPGFLEQMADRAVETGSDITICRAAEFDAQTGKDLPSEWMLKKQYLPGACFAPKEIAAHIFHFTYGWPWDKLYRTAFVREAQVSYPTFSNSEDLVFVFESLAAAERIAVLDEILVHHRVNRQESVSGSRYREPAAPYLAYKMVLEYLEEHENLLLYCHSLRRWAAGFLIWHVSGIEDRTIQRKYFRILRREWLPSLSIHPPLSAWFDSRKDCLKYLLARYAPYPLFAAAVAGHRTVKRAVRQ